jgi:PAS domain S-box-containing protein
MKRAVSIRKTANRPDLWPYGQSEMAKRIREFDWAATSAGDISTWSPQLRAAVDLMLSSPFPVALFWGTDGVLIYNDYYARQAALRHPHILGLSVIEAWPEISDFHEVVMEMVLNDKPLMLEEQSMTLAHTGESREYWYDLTYSPVLDAVGQPQGVFALVVDVTERVNNLQARVRAEDVAYQSELRFRMLSELDDATNDLHNPHEVMEIVTRMVAEKFDVQRCAYADVAEDGDHFTIQHDYCVKGMPSTVGVYSLDLFGNRAAEKMHDGRTLVIRDVDKELTAGNGGAMFSSIKVKATITCPLLKDGKLVAMIALHSLKPRNWNETEIQLFETVAERSWAYIERARLDRELRESEAEFRTLADSMAQMIWVTRPDGYHEYYNKQWYDFTGVPVGSTDGEEWNGMFHPDDQERAWARWNHSLRTGEPYEIEYRLRRHDGVYCWVLGRALPARAEDGSILKWYGTCTDIEEHKRTEKMLFEAREAAEAASLAKSEFLANMSHEIRTPMNAVIGMSHILARTEPLTPKQRDCVKTLQMSAGALLDLINDLLDIAKIESHSVQLEKVPFSMAQLLDDIVSMMSIRAREKGLTLSADSTALENFNFIGDPARLRQVLLNLCSNAVKFTEKGSVRITAHCEPDDRPDMRKVRIDVTDTGIGIAQDKQETIFQKFMQADTSINRKYGGTGLGLAITKTLTEIMDGDILLESEPGKGSTFSLVLSLPVTDQALPAIYGARPEQDDDVTEMQTKPRILLVEDYAPNVLVTGTFLEEFGYDYDVANDGNEALQKIADAKIPYAAVLMDVQMHGMNGLEATAEIRKREQGSQTRLPVIGMTAHALSGDRERCLKAGMDEYLSKPFNPEQLEQLLKSLTQAD